MKEVEVVLAIPVPTDDRNLLCGGDVVPWSDGGSLSESEDLDEEFGEDVK